MILWSFSKMEFLLLFGTYILPVRKRAARTGQSTATAGAAAVVAASTAKAGRPAGAAGRLDPADAALRTKAARGSGLGIA